MRRGRVKLSFYAKDGQTDDDQAPGLDRYDAVPPLSAAADAKIASSVLSKNSAPYDYTNDFKAGLYLEKDAPRTHGRDKALLVALGVDGSVPLAQARVNAGLDAAVVWREAANDNELVAKAA